MDGFFSPNSVTWKIHSDPSMLIGGIRALLEQALHPGAMSGVAAHSNFREDAWGRLQRTGDYVGTLTFGTIEEAEKLAARVRAIHTKLNLDDPHLLLWVHMAMVDAFLDTALRSGLKLSEIEIDQYVAEMVKFAELVGIDAASTPKSKSELEIYFNEIQPELFASDDAKRAALFIALPPLPPLLRFGTPIAPLWGGIASLAAASLPRWARRLYGWPTLPGQSSATDIALRTTRTALSALPSWFRESPQLRSAKERINKAS
ncbi:MAG: oxygenase MpaB family protein [Actinomycetota bacterium]